MSICYQSSVYRWVSLLIFILASIGIVSILIIVITMDKCNDPYHDIGHCLNSTDCDVRYCEPSICDNYTCLPRLKTWCAHEEKIFYPDGNCPNDKLYIFSWVALRLIGVILFDALIYVITLCHYRYFYDYSKVYHHDEYEDDLIGNKDLRLDICSDCVGVGNDMKSGAKCTTCNGLGQVLAGDNKSEVDDF